MKTMIDLDLFQSILKKVEDKVDYADVRVADSQNTSIIMKDGKKKHITLTYKLTDKFNEIEDYDVFRFKVRTKHKIELDPLC